MTTPENRLLPLSAIAAMLVVSTTIVGLAYWVGDAISPGLASIVQASTRDAAARTPAASTQFQRIAPAPVKAESAKSAPASPVLANRIDAHAGR